MSGVLKRIKEVLMTIDFKNQYSRALLAFILLESLFLIVLNVNQYNSSQEYLDLKTTEAKSGYETVHHSFYKISEIVVGSMGENPKIIELLTEAATADEQKEKLIAKKLERHLKEDFLNLKELYFEEIRFILPNGHSFLHLDRSGVFDSDHSGVKTDLDLKGETQKEFRFGHPLFSKEKEVIGSVEFSLSSSTFTEELEKLLETQLNFVKVEDISSLLQIDDYKREIKNGSPQEEDFVDEYTMIDICLQTKAYQSFSMAVQDDENVGTVTFLAVSRAKGQENVNYIVYFKDDPQLAVSMGDYNIIQLAGFLLLAGLFIFGLIRTNRKKVIADRVNQKTFELQESNRLLKERYELTLAGVGDGIWDWDLVNNTIFFSKRWKDMLGYEEDEIENAVDEWKRRIHPDDLEKAIAAVTANMAGKTERLENLHRLKHKDGHWVWVLDRGKTIFDDKGNAVRMLGTHTDVTDKKALEDTVAQNEARLVEAQKIAHLGNWEWDLLSNKIAWSDELYRILGEVPQSFEPTYKSLISYLPLSERVRYKNSMLKIAKDLDSERVYEWKVIRKDGSYAYISSTIKIIYDDRGKALQVQGTFLDVTKGKEAEEQLSLMNSMLVESYKKQKVKTKEVTEAKKELEQSHSEMLSAKLEAEQASRTKSTFLANMSHEIRTPLNAINGFIGLLKDHETDIEKLDYLMIIDSSSESLLQIINDILDFSKIESGKLVIEQIEFAPKKELCGTVELFRLKAIEKEINLAVDGFDMLPKVLHGDVLRVKQILSNLLSNAIKFTDKKGEIKCSIRHEEGRLYIDVEDNGIGIPEEKQEKIFESFTQADDSTVRKYGGTGLGLAVSKNLAKLLDGDLKVESQEDVGSTFSLTIACALGQEEEQEEKVSMEKSNNIAGHVLVVEDNKANQMFVGIVLRNAGLTFDTAVNGLEAIERFKNGKYDVILMDENMPKLNGIGATKEILAIEEEKGVEHTPIIALTANALVGDRQIFMDAGMDEYLTKPIEPKQLIKVIGEMSA